ncbi:MAG: GNAT family N-acetyltransferase [Sneathiellales bacterium]|nr:GNAT family N-acetyltransferase [Sneathiellales bacterium]
MGKGNSGKQLFETERLTFHEAAMQDAEFLLDLLNQPSFLKFIGSRNVHDLDGAKSYIRDLQLQYQIKGFGSYIVRLKEQDTQIGLSGLIRRDELEHADIGFAYHPDYWRRGYALEGAKALMDYGRVALGLQKIIAITSPDNIASQKLLTKLGLCEEKRIMMKGKDEETVVFSPL